MKPRPTGDFPIWVQYASLNEEGSPPELFQGAYNALLNHTVTVTFVPEYPRLPDGWPAIDVPDGYAGPTTVDEARAWVALGASYVVTPGSEPTFARENVYDDSRQSVFFVTAAEYAEIVADLERLAERPRFSGYRVSEVPDLSVVRLLVDRVIPNDTFGARDRSWLTDPSSA